MQAIESHATDGDPYVSTYVPKKLLFGCCRGEMNLPFVFLRIHPVVDVRVDLYAQLVVRYVSEVPVEEQIPFQPTPPILRELLVVAL